MLMALFAIFGVGDGTTLGPHGRAILQGKPIHGEQAFEFKSLGVQPLTDASASASRLLNMRLVARDDVVVSDSQNEAASEILAEPSTETVNSDTALPDDQGESASENLAEQPTETASSDAQSPSTEASTNEDVAVSDGQNVTAGATLTEQPTSTTSSNTSSTSTDAAVVPPGNEDAWPFKPVDSNTREILKKALPGVLVPKVVLGGSPFLTLAWMNLRKKEAELQARFNAYKAEANALDPELSTPMPDLVIPKMSPAEAEANYEQATQLIFDQMVKKMTSAGGKTPEQALEAAKKLEQEVAQQTERFNSRGGVESPDSIDTLDREVLDHIKAVDESTGESWEDKVTQAFNEAFNRPKSGSDSPLQSGSDELSAEGDTASAGSTDAITGGETSSGHSSEDSWETATSDHSSDGSFESAESGAAAGAGSAAGAVAGAAASAAALAGESAAAASAAEAGAEAGAASGGAGAGAALGAEAGSVAASGSAAEGSTGAPLSDMLASGGSSTGLDGLHLPSVFSSGHSDHDDDHHDDHHDEDKDDDKKKEKHHHEGKEEKKEHHSSNSEEKTSTTTSSKKHEHKTTMHTTTKEEHKTTKTTKASATKTTKQHATPKPSASVVSTKQFKKDYSFSIYGKDFPDTKHATEYLKDRLSECGELVNFEVSKGDGDKKSHFTVTGDLKGKKHFDKKCVEKAIQAAGGPEDVGGL